MAEKNVYTSEDCIEAGKENSLIGKVVIICLEKAKEKEVHQLAFCMDKRGEEVLLVDLGSGEYVRLPDRTILGIAKPELLSEHEKLQLSQIRPPGSADLRECEPMYSGYSFLENGSYSSGVWLCSEKEALAYVEIQKRYQYRVMLCDRDDFCVMEIIRGQFIYPTPEDVKTMKEQQEMNL